jgi:hypothetical protein
VRVVDLEPEGEEVEEEEIVDPLDAQRAGAHDEALALGHEEISLNLEDVADGDEAAATEEHAAAKPDR